MVLLDDLVCPIAVKTDTLKELAGISGSHSVISQIVWRQWSLTLLFNKFQKLQPSLILLVLELDWFSPDESLVQSRLLNLNKNVLFRWRISSMHICYVGVFVQLIYNFEICVVIDLADQYFFLWAIYGL